MSSSPSSFRNEFSWSFSRHQTFESCERRYWLRYYAAWGGWEKDAPRQARNAYFFSKMQSLPMAVGSAVHATLEQHLRRIRDGWFPQDPVRELRQRLNDTWSASRRQRWRVVGPKKAPPLYEHHYEIPLPAAQLDALRDRATRSVQNVLASDLYRRIRAAGVSTWLGIEELDTLRLADTPAFVSPDFLFESDDELWLIDWKTGTPREGMSFQLRLYALWVQRTRGVEPERIRAFDYFTAEDRIEEVSVLSEELREAEGRAVESIGRMKRKLVDPAENIARIEDFDPTVDAEECRRCFFRAMCDARRDRSS